MKKTTHSLDFQVDHHLNQLVLQRIYASKLDTHISQTRSRLTTRRNHRPNNRSTPTGVTLANDLETQLTHCTKELNLLVSDNQQLRWRIDQMRLELNDARKQINRTKTEIEEIQGKTEEVRTERKRFEEVCYGYRSQIRSFSMDNRLKPDPKPQTACAKTRHSTKFISILPTLSPEIPTGPLIQDLISTWQRKITEKRLSLTHHQTHILSLMEGFSLMHKNRELTPESDFSQLVQEISMWAAKERDLRANLSEIQDTVTETENSLATCQAAMTSLENDENRREWGTVLSHLSRMQLVSQCVRETGGAPMQPPEDIQAFLKDKTEKFKANLKKTVTVEEIKAKRLIDILQLVWDILHSDFLKILTDTGLSSESLSDYLIFSVDDLVKLLFSLEFSLFRLEGLAIRLGSLPLRDSVQLQPRSSTRIRPSTTATSGPEVDRPLTKAEFRERLPTLLLQVEEQI